MDKSRLLNLVSEDNEKTVKHISHGAKALEGKIHVNDSKIWNYIQCLYLEKETQDMIGII